MFKKNKIIALSLSATVLSATATGVIVYLANSDSRNSTDYRTTARARNNLVAKDNLDLTNTSPSNADSNLKEKPKKIEPPKVEPPKETKPKPIVKVEPPKETKPEPKPVPKPEPKPEPKPQPKPILKEEETKQTIKVNGVEVYGNVKPLKPRDIPSYDSEKGLSSDYINHTVPEVLSIEVTEELIKKSIKDTIGTGTKEGLNSTWVVNMVSDALTIQDPDELNKFINQNADFWKEKFYKWQRLFDSPKIRNFLKEDKKTEYDEMISQGKFKGKEHRYLWIYSNLDWSKLNKLSSSAQEQLKKGYVLDPSNSYINENGELDSHAYSPPEGHNVVIARRVNDNKNRRTFSYDSPYGRSPDDIRDGVYPGWKSEDVTLSDQRFSGIVEANDGFKLVKMQREKPSNEPGQINEGLVVEIDASNYSGYNKTIKLLEKIKSENINVTAFRIKNMGEKDSAQRFKPILEALPNDIQLLELYFSDKGTNTGSLIALENKNIKELSLYTLGNSLKESWSINPWAVYKTKWVNTNDYNVSFGYQKGAPIATRITFNALAFEESDIKKGTANEFERINDGLRMAYYSRNNWPFFQGGFGPGLNPDHNEGNNSYPTDLDFSRAPSIKTLRGLVFRDAYKSSNAPRKVWTVKFYNNKSTYDIGDKDLTNAGFENFAPPAPGKNPKIVFSNNTSTSGFKITSNDLSSSAITNLHTFIRLVRNGNSGFAGTVTVVNNPTLANKLRSAGFTVIESSDTNDEEFN
ncbi:hypothetical protein MBVG596_0882 [Mycoplasmopsis bovigenitalium]|uniref:putative immunoglobulin-blocking virulence protein n=1 Tax=Mycoplasmopsis bovigenitalium TaxID=2112 RepID=UPI00090CCB73|nr:putative immunoglobulin-blocking virulence protein [Mycoplasmopsis bovigenitalium]BAW18461.1 hypothetical protein MBVG596_0882 [Mycoplasmopsis bovigenitalium]